MLIRNKLYDWKIFKSYSFNVPVISIGNLSVGGTGKTPHIEYLIRLLQNSYLIPHTSYLNIAVLSRGYKRKTKGFIIASENSTLEQIGDEPLQFKTKFQNITVAVDENRVNGINHLLENHSLLTTYDLRLTTNFVILLDDAFQHRRVIPGLSILLIDYTKEFLILNSSVSQFLSSSIPLPSGSLREYRTGYKRADIIIVTKTPENLSSITRQNIIDKIKPLPHQKVYFSFIKYCPLVPLNNDYIKNINTPFSILHSQSSILLFAGIANPNIFVQKVKEIYAVNNQHQTPRSLLPTHCSILFNDHHIFSKKDILMIKDKFQKITGNNKIIITTEKDARRLNKPELIDILKDMPVYYLPIEIDFHKEDKDPFNSQILKFITPNH